MFSSSCCFSAPQLNFLKRMVYTVSALSTPILSLTHFNWAFLSTTHWNSTHLGNQRTSSCQFCVLVLLIRSTACDCLSLLFLKILPVRFPDILSSGSQVLSYTLSPGDRTKSDSLEQIQLLPWALSRAQDSNIQLLTSQLHSYRKLHSSSPHLIKKLYQHLHSGCKQQHRSDV